MSSLGDPEGSPPAAPSLVLAVEQGVLIESMKYLPIEDLSRVAATSTERYLWLGAGRNVRFSISGAQFCNPGP